MPNTSHVRPTSKRPGVFTTMNVTYAIVPAVASILGVGRARVYQLINVEKLLPGERPLENGPLAVPWSALLVYIRERASREAQQ